jgi:hypothetical protein
MMNEVTAFELRSEMRRMKRELIKIGGMEINTAAKRIEAGTGSDWDTDDYCYTEKVIRQTISDAIAKKDAEIERLREALKIRTGS